MSEPAVHFSHIQHPESSHDLASPVAVTIPGHDMAHQPVFLLKAVGGLTKLEHVAAMIMAGNSRDFSLWEHGDDAERKADLGRIASRCVDAAEAMLAECAKRQAPKESERPSPIEVAG